MHVNTVSIPRRRQICSELSFICLKLNTPTPTPTTIYIHEFPNDTQMQTHMRSHDVQLHGHGVHKYIIPYSRKYWRELNLVVEPKIAIARILADLSMVVWYGIATRMYVSRKLLADFNLAVVI